MINENDYYPGDMTYENNLIFQDTLKHDIRINGHPVLVLTAAKFGEKFYALKISGSYRNVQDLDNYYMLKPNRKKGIFKTSYIDLRYIYELECKNKKLYIQVVTEKELMKIIERLQITQITMKSENYKYIENYYKKA